MQYYEMTETLMKSIDVAIASILGKDEYDQLDNMPEVLSKLYEAKRYYEYLHNIHKFLKMSKTSFLKLAGDQTAQRETVNHTVKSYESPLGIAQKYGVTLSEMLDSNGKIASNIQDGDELTINIKNDNNTQLLLDTIPTFGDHTGIKLYGTDLPKVLIEDDRKDLLVLDEYSTLKQGIYNIVTTNNGDYPLNETFGIMDLTKISLPNDLGDNLLKMRINDAIMKDSRIEKVISIDSERKNNSVIFEIQALTILQQNITIGV